jgi:toxin HigB-1
MIRSFRDTATEDLFYGRDSKAARRRLPIALWSLASRKLDAVDQADALGDLRLPPGNRLEALRGHRAGQHSIRINEQCRICFVWSEGGADDVEVADYHPG